MRKRMAGIVFSLALSAIPSAFADVAAPAPASAPAVATPASPTAAPASTFDPIAEVGEAAKNLDAAIAAGDDKGAENFLSQLADWKGRLSADNLFFVSRMLIARADVLAKAGKKDRAAQTARYATLISPADSHAWFTLAVCSFRRNTADFSGYANAAYRGARVWMESPLNGWILAARALAAVTLGALFAFMIFSVAFLARHLPTIGHDLQRLLPFEMAPRFAAATVALLLLCVLFTGGVLAACAALALVLAGYAGTQGRVALAAYLAVFAAMPFLIQPIGKGIALESSRAARAAGYFLNGGWEPAEIKTLEEAAAQYPDDTQLRLILGTYYRKMQDFDAATRHLQQAFQRDDRDVRIIMELASVHFGKAEFREAELGYKNALSLSPNLFEGHFNLSRAYLEQFRTEEAEQALDAASRINKEKTNQLLVIASKATINAAKVASVPPAHVLPKFVNDAVARDGARMAEKIWDFYMPHLSMGAYLAAAVGYLLLFAAAIILLSRTGLHTICSSCGAVYLPLFMKDKGGGKCDRCVALSSAQKTTVIGPRDKARQSIRQYQARQRKRANTLNTILPGAGSVWYGAHLAGGVLVFFTGVFAAKAFDGIFLVAAGYRPETLATYALGVAAFALFYLLTVPFTMRGD